MLCNICLYLRCDIPEAKHCIESCNYQCSNNLLILKIGAASMSGTDLRTAATTTMVSVKLAHSLLPWLVPEVDLASDGSGRY